MKMTNVLVQYQGGGYSGCVWEWNFFFLDKDGKFHDIFSSGQDGITTQEQADDLVVEQPSNVYFYDVTKESAWQEFSKECHPALVIMVIGWFDDRNFDLGQCAYCSECDHIADDPIYIPYCGEDRIFCDDCYVLGLCDCGQWSEDIQKYGDEYLCPDCRDYRDREKLAEQQHDLLWASLTTGTPDLFSEKMRWLFDRK
jgi:hypothetical protein